jgi:uncharacterized protein YeaO (DUF488 family)
VDAAVEHRTEYDIGEWFGHDPPRWQKFRHRYEQELLQHVDLLEQLRKMARNGNHNARDEAHNDAVLLREVLNSRSQRQVKDA